MQRVQERVVVKENWKGQEMGGRRWRGRDWLIAPPYPRLPNLFCSHRPKCEYWRGEHTKFKDTQTQTRERIETIGERLLTVIFGYFLIVLESLSYFFRFTSDLLLTIFQEAKNSTLLMKSWMEKSSPSTTHGKGVG